MSKPRTVANLKREADEMVARGEMPSLEEVLRAIAGARKTYRARLKFERLKEAGRPQ